MSSHTLARTLLMAAGSLLLTAGCSLASRGKPEAEPAPRASPPAPARSGGAEREASQPKIAVFTPSNARAGLSAHARKLARRKELRTPHAEAGYYMDVQEAQLRQELRGTPATLLRGDDGIVVRLPEEMIFETGGTTLKAGAEGFMAKIAAVLEEFHKTVVVVTGRAHDQRLSQGRAIAVTHRLLQDGVGAERLVAVGGAGNDGAVEIALELIVEDGT